MFEFLLIVQTLVAIGLITVILMQRSEGGGLAGGGSPAGLMTARGAADFLTRATTILATIFIVLSIVLAALAAQVGGTGRLDDAPAPAQTTPGGQLGPAQPGTDPAIPTLQPQGPASAPAPAPAQPQGGAAAPAGQAPAAGNQGAPSSN